jgi:Lrp/AsnC family transcriptional regulator
VRVSDPAAYDAFYRSLTADISIFNVTSLLSMEEIISRTRLKLDPQEPRET